MAANRRDSVKIKRVMENGDIQHDTIKAVHWNDERQTYQKKGWVLDVPDPVAATKRTVSHENETETAETTKAKKAKTNLPD